MDNKSISHTRWKCQYHIVFIPKYRKKTLYGKVKEDIREIIKTLCKYKDVEIIAGAVCVDHIHLSVAIRKRQIVRTSTMVAKCVTIDYISIMGIKS